MPNRVLPFAMENGYVTYPGLKNAANYAPEELLAHNRAQIEMWKAEGRQIIDIGPAPNRAFYPMETSEAYAMEHNAVRDYSLYKPMAMDGEPNWLSMLVRNGS
jgi:hypothetical protein